VGNGTKGTKISNYLYAVHNVGLNLVQNARAPIIALSIHCETRCIRYWWKFYVPRCSTV